MLHSDGGDLKTFSTRAMVSPTETVQLSTFQGLSEARTPICRESTISSVFEPYMFSF